MKIAMCQNNYTVGDFSGNYEKMRACIDANKESDLIVFSELSLSGYYPQDLVYRDNFHTRQNDIIRRIMEKSKETQAAICFGYVEKNTSKGDKSYYNSMMVVQNGEIVFNYRKQLLPTYNIFNERRHFAPGDQSGLCNLYIPSLNAKKEVGFLICEDGWNDEAGDYLTNPVKDLVNSGASVLVSLNASPANTGKTEQREQIFGGIAKKYGVHFVYVNQVGGNDDIVFDGNSFVFNNKGKKVIQMPAFAEFSTEFDTEKKYEEITTPIFECKEDFIFQQLQCGLKDYLGKLGIKKVVIGCSGGVDSALSTAICALALGPENVIAITMPSEYSSSGSVNDSAELCKNLNVKLLTHPIKEQVEIARKNFEAVNGEPLKGVALENLQARIRAQILLAYSNQYGHMVIGNSNKSEASVGYSTIFGDSACSLLLISDLLKTQVWALCDHINKKYGYTSHQENNELIPSIIINKAPSAELAPGQKDSDALPPYPVLDAILQLYINPQYLTKEEKENCEEMIKDLDKGVISKVLNLIDRAEFKRRQSAPIIRAQPLSFGDGRQIPIVQKLGFEHPVNVKELEQETRPSNKIKP